MNDTFDADAPDSAPALRWSMQGVGGKRWTAVVPSGNLRLRPIGRDA